MCTFLLNVCLCVCFYLSDMSLTGSKHRWNGAMAPHKNYHNQTRAYLIVNMKFKYPRRHKRYVITYIWKHLYLHTNNFQMSVCSTVRPSVYQYADATTNPPKLLKKKKLLNKLFWRRTRKQKMIVLSNLRPNCWSCCSADRGFVLY